MAAFTEGFTDTSQPGKDHIGAMISRVIAARKFARDERELAEEKAKKAGYDSLEEIGVEKGFFFKAALKSKFGGSFISGKVQDVKQGIERVKLLKNPKAQFWNFVDNRDADGNEVKKLSAIERFRAQFDNYAFVSAKRPPEVSPDDPTVPNTGEETAKSASGRRGKVSREDILQAVTAIAASLERTAQSINNNVQESRDIASGINAIHTDVVTQLSERTDSIEAKLDAIIAAINAQTDLQKKFDDDAETIQSTKEQKQISNTADAFNFDDLDTPENEERQDDMQLDSSPAATSSQQAEFDQQDAYNNPPQAETGGIISGPDEGYLAKLHGDEMVIPLDNNYTQGQPSAMDGKVRPVPQTAAISPKMQSFERGTAPTSGMNRGSNLGGKIGFTPMNLGAITAAAGGDVDKMSQPLMDAMSLPMMVAGGTILSSVTNMMNALGPENDDISGEISKVARPIADVFGLPNTLTNKAIDPSSARNADGSKNQSKKEKDKKEKKGLFGKVLDKISKLMGGGGDGGGGGGGGGAPEAKNVPEGREDKIAAAVKFYKEKGLSDEGAAYMVGNLLQESGLRTDAVGDNGKAFGLAQWRIDEASGARWKGYMKWAKENGKDPGDFYSQLEYTLVEGETYNKGLTTLKGNDKEAIMRYIKAYEGYSVEGDRFGYGEDILRKIDAYKSATPPSSDKPSPPGQIDSAQKITQNFGLKTHEKFFFNHNGVQYEAYKTTKGFEIFKHGIRLNTNGKNLDVVNALIKAGQERQAQSIKPPESSGDKSTKPGTETASALRPTRKDGGVGQGTTVVAMASAAQSKTSNTTQRPDSSQAVGEGGDNNLRAMYNPNGVVA